MGPSSDAKIARVLEITQNLIAETLGDFDWEESVSLCDHGSGATTSLPRRRASKANKWDFESHVTAAALPYCVAFASWTRPAFGPGNVLVGDHSFTVVECDTLDSVNKNVEGDELFPIKFAKCFSD